MTTVAYNHKTKELGSDGQATCGYTTVSTSTAKLYRVDGGWLAFCGGYADALSLMDYLAGVEMDIKDLQVGGFVLPDKGNPYELCISSAGVLHQVEIKGNFAMGSGRDYALGALEVGASTRDAVKASIKYDVFSGGKVVVKKKGALK